MLSLDDSPHKYLPWFRMADREANELVTLRDMLCHRTGLRSLCRPGGRAGGPLARRVHQGGHVRPSRRRSFARNSSTRTQCSPRPARRSRRRTRRAGRALIESAILGPLGMTSSRTSTDAGAAMPDHALGYVYSPESKD